MVPASRAWPRHCRSSRRPPLRSHCRWSRLRRQCNRRRRSQRPLQACPMPCRKPGRAPSRRPRRQCRHPARRIAGSMSTAAGAPITVRPAHPTGRRTRGGRRTGMAGPRTSSAGLRTRRYARCMAARSPVAATGGMAAVPRCCGTIMHERTGTATRPVASTRCSGGRQRITSGSGAIARGTASGTQRHHCAVGGVTRRRRCAGARA